MSEVSSEKMVSSLCFQICDLRRYASEQLRLMFSTFVIGLGVHAMRAATRIPK
jgi:hypothetical protein